MSHIDDFADALEDEELPPDEEDAQGSEGDQAADDDASGDAEGDEGGEDGGEHEEAEGAAEHEVEPPARREGRAARTIREQRERAQKAERELTETRERLQRLEQQGQQQTLREQQEDFTRREQEFLATATEGERLDYLRQKDNRQLQGQMQQLQLQIADTSDRTAFEAECSRHDVLRKLAPEVEGELAKMRAAGGTGIPRLAIAQFLIGKKAMESASRNLGKQGKRAQAGVRREAAKPGRPAGDVGAQRRGGKKDDVSDFEKRYGNYKFT